MTIGVVGIGLIGGSVARAYKLAEGAENTLLCADKNDVMLQYSILTGVTDEVLTADNIGRCDLIFLCLYPEASAEFLQLHGANIRPDAVVIDCCGTKRKICEVGFALSKEYGFTFVGGHPMAGTHNSGFKFSRADLFVGAPMVIVPPSYDDMALYDRIKGLLAPLGFGSISVTTAERHDSMIAFTSQMAHIVSNAYVKSPEAREHHGFSAGSYRDLTRVAWLNPDMWTELFLENDDCLLRELDHLIGCLGDYRDAIADGDRARLWQLLDDGRRIKGEIDGRK